MTFHELIVSISNALGQQASFEEIVLDAKEAFSLVSQAIRNHQTNEYGLATELTGIEFNNEHGYVVFDEPNDLEIFGVEIIKYNGVESIPNTRIYMVQNFTELRPVHFPVAFFDRDPSDSTKLRMWVSDDSLYRPISDEWIIKVLSLSEDIVLTDTVDKSIEKVIRYFVYAQYDKAKNTIFQNAYRDFSNKISSDLQRW